jgi:hypothetical protein
MLLGIIVVINDRFKQSINQKSAASLKPHHWFHVCMPSSFALSQTVAWNTSKSDHKCSQGLARWVDLGQDSSNKPRYKN